MKPQDAAREARNAAQRAVWRARRNGYLAYRAALVARYEPPAQMTRAQRAAVLAAHLDGTLTLGGGR